MRPAEKRPRLVDVFPPFDTYNAYWTTCAVPAGFSPGVGDSGFYGLMRINVDEDTGEQINLHGVTAHLLPTDPDAVAGAGAWGNTNGLLAGVVVGRNLPAAQGEWATGRGFVPGLEPGVDHSDNTPGTHKRYQSTFTFPPGKLGATSLTKAVIPRTFAPLAARFPLGSTLDVNLVLNRAQVMAAAGGTVGGFVAVELLVGKTRHSAAFID